LWWFYVLKSYELVSKKEIVDSLTVDVLVWHKFLFKHTDLFYSWQIFASYFYLCLHLMFITFDRAALSTDDALLVIYFWPPSQVYWQQFRSQYFNWIEVVFKLVSFLVSLLICFNMIYKMIYLFIFYFCAHSHLSSPNLPSSQLTAVSSKSLSNPHSISSHEYSSNNRLYQIQITIMTVPIVIASFGYLTH